MATARPTAVVSSASEMPADTVARPPPPLVGSAMLWKALMMPNTVPKRPTNGADDDTMDRTDMIKRMMTTPLATTPMWFHMSTNVNDSIVLSLLGENSPLSFVAGRPDPCRCGTISERCRRHRDYRLPRFLCAGLPAFFL